MREKCGIKLGCVLKNLINNKLTNECHDIIKEKIALQR